MKSKTVYVAFDYDDLAVKQGLIEQARPEVCPFKLRDASIDRTIPTRWVATARRLIAECDCVIVLCGIQTHQASGVFTELQLAQELGKPYFLLRGTRTGTPTRPKNARASDQIWAFRWATVSTLLQGKTPPPDAAV